MSPVVVEKAKDWRRGAVVAAGVAAVAGAVYYYYWGRSSRGRKRDHSAVRKIMATRPSQSEQRFDIVGLYVYPVKSMKGVALETSGFDHLGLKNDRRFCVINAATGNLVTQRDNRLMALVRLVLDGQKGTLQFRFGEPEAQSPAVPLNAGTTGGLARTVTIWRVPIPCVDCGDDISKWLTKSLNKGSKRAKDVPYRLVRLAPGSFRDTNKYDTKWGTAYSKEDRAGFSDCSQYLVTFTKSLAYLDECLPPNTIESMRRFRPNIVLQSHVPFEEDWISRMRVVPKQGVGRRPPIELKVNKGCHRCTMCTINQETGERTAHNQPLNLLREFRVAKDGRFENSPSFGLNVSRVPLGAVGDGDGVDEDGASLKFSVGDAVVVTRQVFTNMQDCVPVQNHSK